MRQLSARGRTEGIRGNSPLVYGLLLSALALTLASTSANSTAIETGFIAPALPPAQIGYGNEFVNAQITPEQWTGPQPPPMTVTFEARNQGWTARVTHPVTEPVLSYDWIVCGNGYDPEPLGPTCQSTNFSSFPNDLFTYTFQSYGFGEWSGKPLAGPEVYSVILLIRDNVSGLTAASSAIVYLDPSGDFEIYGTAVTASMNVTSAKLPSWTSSVPVHTYGLGYLTNNSSELDSGIIGLDNNLDAPVSSWNTLQAPYDNPVGPSPCIWRGGPGPMDFWNATFDLGPNQAGGGWCSWIFWVMPAGPYSTNTGSCSPTVDLATPATDDSDQYGSETTCLATIAESPLSEDVAGLDVVMPAFAMGEIYFNVTTPSSFWSSLVSSPFLIPGAIAAAGVAAAATAITLARKGPGGRRG